MTTNKLLILAGTASQAAQFCRENGLSLSSARWVMSPDQIRGYKDPEFVVTGTFWTSPNCIPIWQALCLAHVNKPKPKAPDDIEPFLQPTLPTYGYRPATIQDPVMPDVAQEPCLRCGRFKPISEYCPECGPPEFKHIEDVPPPKKTFKRIKK